MPPRASSATSASSGRRRGEGRGRRSRVTSTTRVRGTRSTCAFRSSASTSPARSLPARRCGCSAGSRWMAGPTSARPCPTRPATACRCSHSTGPAVVVAAAAGCEPVGRPERLAPPQREARPGTGPCRPRPSALESAPGMDTPPRPDATVGAAARYRTLLEINNAVVSNLTQDALFHAIAQALRRVVAFDRTAVFLHDPERDVLRLFVLESSLSTSYFTVGLEMPSGESHVGRVFKTQRSLLRHDLAKERQYPMEDRALEDGVRSTAIGTLAVASVKPNQYDVLRVALRQEVWQACRGGLQRDPGSPDGLPVAGEHPRASERHRARGRALEWTESGAGTGAPARRRPARRGRGARPTRVGKPRPARAGVARARCRAGSGRAKSHSCRPRGSRVGHRGSAGRGEDLETPPQHAPKPDGEAPNSSAQRRTSRPVCEQLNGPDRKSTRLNSSHGYISYSEDCPLGPLTTKLRGRPSNRAAKCTPDKDPSPPANGT